MLLALLLLICGVCAVNAKLQADVCSSKGSLDHGNQQGQGQNIAMANPAPTAKAAVDMWYDEIYVPGNPSLQL